MRLLDSDVLIAHLRGAPAAREWLREERLAGPLTVSVLSLTEIMGGTRSGERREVAGLLSRLRTEPVTAAIARRAGEFMRTYRRSHPGIGTVDYLIAATADLLGYEPATLNVKHYPMFKGLRAPFTL